jgi:environmental stress-induced protein Ves
VHTFRGAALPVYRWANGGGASRRIVAVPPTAGPADPALVWQASLATIEADGPFSALAGVDRQIVLMEGGATLGFPRTGVTQRLGALEPFAFRGDDGCDCRLATSRAIALNVMVRRNGRRHARLEVLRPTSLTIIEKPVGTTLLCVVAAGRMRVLANGAAAHLDEAGDGFLLEGPGYGQASLTPAGAGSACILARVAAEA